MNLKTTSTCLSAFAIIAQCITPLPTHAAQPTFAPGIIYGGGQAPPGAAGGSGGYTVRVAGKLPQATADALRDELVKEGFATAKTRQGSDGAFEVVVGAASSKDQAEAILAELKTSGYTPDSIIDVGTQATGASGSVYRVEVAEFGSAAEAAEASKVLADEGFVNVDVVQEKNLHLVMLGTFNRKADAEALLTQVNEAGFAMAIVVNRERLGTAASDNLATADLSQLSPSEQQQTRNVLEMAEKVEAGDATAAEATQLREMIQQLPDNQRAIVGQQESSRSAGREKMQKIFALYRDFERAMANRDYAGAERALAEVKQADPNDMFLPSRLQALEIERNGGTAGPRTGATASSPPDSSAVDPAQVQQLLNDGRALEAADNPGEALSKYRQVLAMDPTNVEARQKVASLDSGGEPASESADGTGGLAALTQNKPLLYGIGGAIALLIIVMLWMKSRGRKSETRGSASPGNHASGPDFIDPLAPAGGYNASSTPTPLGSTALPAGLETTAGSSSATAGSEMAGAAMPDFTMMDDGIEEEPEDTTPAPAPPPPATEENDMVSFEEFESAPNVAAAPAVADDDISINIDDESTPSPAAAPAQEAKPARPASSMDADLEALLKGTFGGESPADESVPESLEPALAAAGETASAAATGSVIYQQDYNEKSEGSSPADWRGEFDYSTLTIVDQGDAGHEHCLKFEKPEGVGSATYHLSFPPAKGQVVVEFDIRCDDKNKFLLGIYLERDEDFKQSVHTIVHQLDTNGPASLRVQGQAVPYQMETWRKMRYEIDLPNGMFNGFVDGEQVVTESRLPVAPDYFNTFSIRDNLATTGTLYLDNIRITEA